MERFSSHEDLMSFFRVIWGVYGKYNAILRVSSGQSRHTTKQKSRLVDTNLILGPKKWGVAGQKKGKRRSK
jgi:hypothetical protein